MKSASPLQKELDHQRFLHAIQYVRNESRGIKKLTTAELTRINQFLCGKANEPEFDPWRIEPVSIRIPTGTTLQMNLISNPVVRARDLLGRAQQLSGNLQGLEGASSLYSNLVLEHLFKFANRRTAVAAALWILLASGLDCDAEALLALPVGDLRQDSEFKSLTDKMKGIVRAIS